MSQLFKKALRKKVVIIVLVIMTIAILWVPLVWGQDLVFDKVRFTNEYYGVLIDIGKIFLAFWLANIFLRGLRQTDFAHEFEQNWKEQTQLLCSAFQELHLVPERPEMDSKAIRALAERIQNSDAILLYLSSKFAGLPDVVNLGLASNQPVIYRDDIHYSVKRIIAHIDSGEIIALRPFSQDVLISIDDILTKLSC